jgi:hypothetical protein
LLLKYRHFTNEGQLVHWLVFDNLLELEWEKTRSMQLFHHITVLSLSEQEKRAFVEAGVEFARTMKSARGETVIFDIGENDPRYERVAALLRSLDLKRVRDFSMTVPTLREFVAKMVANGRERMKQEATEQAKWPRGREVLRESLELMKSGKVEQAFSVLDPITQKSPHNRLIAGRMLSPVCDRQFPF